MENIVEVIKNFVRDECKKLSSRYGYESYESHFIPMVNFYSKLAKRLNADLKIVELAAWLHDVGSIIYRMEKHYITISEIVEKKLKGLSYSEERIKLIKHCVVAYRGSQDISKESVEAQIIADSDVLSHFDRIEGLFKAAFIYENLNQQDTKKSVREKLIFSFNKLFLQESKMLIKPKYDLAMLLFGD